MESHVIPLNTRKRPSKLVPAVVAPPHETDLTSTILTQNKMKARTLHEPHPNKGAEL